MRLLPTRTIAILLQVMFLFSCSSNAQQTGTINVNEFEKSIALPNIQLLDVRTSAEYQSGHLANALQADWTNENQFKERAAALDTTKPLYLYCLSGVRSNDAMQWLSKNGFTKVYNMKGGINAWKQANKPIQGSMNVKQITLQEFQAQIPIDKIVLVDIGAEWCPPCKKMKPVIDSLEQEKFNVIKIDGGTQTELCKELHVDAFPVFIIYKNGKETTRKQGVLSLEELKKLLQ